MLACAVLLASALAGVPPAPPQRDPDPRITERDALRALALVAAGEPGIVEVQEAAVRTADREVPEAEGFALRARAAALLPRLTVEARRDERSYRVTGLQAAGEVDYRHDAPGTTLLLRATWELGELVAAKGELAAANASEARARRRAEAVRRATAAFYERRSAQLALLLAPPEGALARAEAELEIERLAAELDALTGGLLSGRRR
jgi:hypothetical protein